VRIADLNCQILHDVEIQGAPVIDKLFFLDPNEVFAQWSNKLFHITIDPPSVTSLPGLPGEMRVDPSGKALAVQRDGTRPLLPDGRYLLSEYNEHAAALRLWRSGDLRDQACARLTSNLSHDEWNRWFPSSAIDKSVPTCL
jgi:hypothetical protein